MPFCTRHESRCSTIERSTRTAWSWNRTNMTLNVVAASILKLVAGGGHDPPGPSLWDWPVTWMPAIVWQWPRDSNPDYVLMSGMYCSAVTILVRIEFYYVCCHYTKSLFKIVCRCWDSNPDLFLEMEFKLLLISRDGIHFLSVLTIRRQRHKVWSLAILLLADLARLSRTNEFNYLL